MYCAKEHEVLSMWHELCWRVAASAHICVLQKPRNPNVKEVAQVSNVAAVRTHVSHVPASVSSGNCDISSFDVAMLDGIAKTCVCVGVCVSVCVCF